jgi:hypothetical protein
MVVFLASIYPAPNFTTGLHATPAHATCIFYSGFLDDHHARLSACLQTDIIYDLPPRFSAYLRPHRLDRLRS